MRVAVRERETSNAFRVESREYLGDTAATIVSDKIHLIEGDVFFLAFSPL